MDTNADYKSTNDYSANCGSEMEDVLDTIAARTRNEVIVQCCSDECFMRAVVEHSLRHWRNNSGVGPWEVVWVRVRMNVSLRR
jgi:hypothetical protein